MTFAHGMLVAAGFTVVGFAVAVLRSEPLGAVVCGLLAVLFALISRLL